MALVAAPAAAAPVPDAIAAKIAVPAGFAVAHVYAPSSIAALDVGSDDFTIEAPRDPRPGRCSVRATFARTAAKAVAGHTVWVQVELVAASAADAGSDIASDAPAVIRGTKVTLVVRAGAVVVHTPALLEASARVGETVLVRIPATHAVAHGRLVAVDTVEVVP
jgi:hypothetical protein